MVRDAPSIFLREVCSDQMRLYQYPRRRLQRLAGKIREAWRVRPTGAATTPGGFPHSDNVGASSSPPARGPRSVPRVFSSSLSSARASLRWEPNEKVFLCRLPLGAGGAMRPWPRFPEFSVSSCHLRLTPGKLCFRRTEDYSSPEPLPLGGVF